MFGFFEFFDPAAQFGSDFTDGYDIKNYRIRHDVTNVFKYSRLTLVGDNLKTAIS